MTTTRGNKQFRQFLCDCNGIGLNTQRIERLALASLAYYKGRKEQRTLDEFRDLRYLERSWYQSLARGIPDYSVYGDESYVADLWACWYVYSRRYIRLLSTIVDQIGPIQSVVDLGCGIGQATAALLDIFPGADVTGTNLPGLSQTVLARKLGERFGFKIVCDLTDVGSRDLVFASEYFEHFPAPVAHLQQVLTAVKPRVLIVANTFSSRSIGHFPLYDIDGLYFDGSATSRAFGNTLRSAGYKRLATGFWNNRPAVWTYDAKETP